MKKDNVPQFLKDNNHITANHIKEFNKVKGFTELRIKDGVIRKVNKK